MNRNRPKQTPSTVDVVAKGLVWGILSTVAICLLAVVGGQVRDAASAAMDQLALGMARCEYALRSRAF